VTLGHTGQVTRLFTALLAFCLFVAACSPADEGAEPEPGEAVVDHGTGEAEAGASATGDGGADEVTTPEGGFTYSGEREAPDFPPALDWLNVSRPLSLTQDLQGKIVVLDFWTQGCINCIHIIPDLKRLQAEYPESLVVVGVHWAKFDHERTLDAVQQASLRYGREEPIVNDEFELIRNTYGVNAWPTLILIDPEGRVVGGHSGEGVYDLFQPIIDTMAKEYGAAGAIDTTALDVRLAATELLPTVLAFPGKVLADEASNRLFITDTGHHRVLVSDLDGELLDVIGVGHEGAVDGTFADASFSRPQGLALSEDGRTLYIADRENHLIRAADLVTREVSTIAGVGTPAFRFEPGPALQTPIASPWDLHLRGSQLLIAGAGRHQIWVLELESGFLDLFAGTGAEGLDDGHRLRATLSQPSGFAADADMLFFTDPEASAVRAVSFDDDQLTTLVGDGLFVWGDEIGSFEDTKLQHAIGVELVDGSLYVADTYNHRLKVLDLDTRESRTILGDGLPGLTDGRGQSAQLDEPSGLSLAGRRLYIADTNNHQVRVLDVDTGELSTLLLTNLELATITAVGLSDDEVVLPPTTLAPGRVQLTVEFDLPEGYKYNTIGTFRFEWTADDPAYISAVTPALYEAQGPETPLTFDIEVAAGGGSNVIYGDTTVFYCLIAEEAFCLIRGVTFELPVEVAEGGESAVQFRHPLPSAEELENQMRGG